MGISESLRLLHISWIFIKHGLDEFILATHLFRPVRFLIWFSPFYWARRNKLPPYPVRLRLVLEELGPIFVKFGQILSTRRDLLPEDIANELTLLQDRVPPFPGAVARRIVERAWGHELDEYLEHFEETPMASASMAQVHAARLRGSGKDVVVKVLRPGIEKTIRRDVKLLYIIARLAQKYWREGRRLRPVEVVQDYERTILDELDLQREAANAAQLRRNWEGSSMLYIPEVFWDYSRRDVLVLEHIHGTPVGRIQELKTQGISMQQLGEQGVEIFFTQVFRDNFFHADMHPGNIFVEPDGRYIAVDFGIVGSLSTADQRYLAENLLAFFNRDYYRVAELHLESRWVPESTRVDEFEAAIRSVCEPIFNKPLAEISFGHFLVNLFQTARRFDMEVQPQLVLLQKTLLYIEGLGRQLYPELDLWSTAKPFLERWMREQVGPRAFLRKLKRNLPIISEHAADFPLLVHRAITDSSQARQELAHQAEELSRLRQDLKRRRAQTTAATGGSALVIGGSLMLTFAQSAALPPQITLGLGGTMLALGAAGILHAWLRN